MPDAPARPPTAVSEEDAKLVTLARATRARTGAAEGAAVRDTTGRTYSAATVGLRMLKLSALQAAVAAAVASSAEALEAAAIVSPSDPADDPVLAELSCRLLLIADPSGTVTGIREYGDRQDATYPNKHSDGAPHGQMQS